MTAVSTSFSSGLLPEIPPFHGASEALFLPMTYVDAGTECVRKRGKIRMYQHQSVIRLLDKDNSLACAQRVLEAIQSVAFSVSKTMVGQSSEFLSRDYAFRDVASDDLRGFFSYLTSQRLLAVPFYDLQDTLQKLVDKNKISSDQREQLSFSIPTVLTEALFEERVQNHSSEQMALALARRYEAEESWMKAALWLAKALTIMLNKRGLRWKSSEGSDLLKPFVDLSTFWNHVQKISGEGIEIFFQGMEELIDSAAAAPSLREVSFKSSFPRIRWAIPGLGRFLERSSSVERVSIAGIPGDGCMNEDFSPIVQALRVNTTLKALAVKDFAIGDQGVCSMVDAILANQNSQMSSMELALIDMTDEGARSLVELVQARPGLHIRLIMPLGVSRELQQIITDRFGERITIDYPRVR